jgi:hypothetical protein
MLAAVALAAGAQQRELDFDGAQAHAHLRAYMDRAPVLPGSPAAASLAQYVRAHLEPLGYQVGFDEWSGPEAPVPLRNIVATRGDGPVLHLVGAHYDARQWADKDPDPQRRKDPVPGANDGGSGVAVLLELARAVDLPPGKSLRLAFFDAEDQGGIPGWGGPYGGWLLGSERMASRLDADERARIADVIVVDIVGSPGLRLQREGYSDPQLAGHLWSIAARLGYADTFEPGDGGAITDDHLPFRALGLRVLDLIQITGRDGSAFFAEHHTTRDTIEKVSTESLTRVGRTLEAYLEETTVPLTAPSPGLFLRLRPVGWLLGGGLLAAALVGYGLRRRRAAAATPLQAVPTRGPGAARRPR